MIGTNTAVHTSPTNGYRVEQYLNTRQCNSLKGNMTQLTQSMSKRPHVGRQLDAHISQTDF